MLIKKLFSLLILSLLILPGCATNPVTGQQDLVFMSEQDEINLGKQVNQQVLQQYSIYDDLDLQNYVQAVGSKVAANSHRSHLSFQFTVVDSQEVNAFALPGGYIYITRGLMAYLNSEAELAAVLGHEIGHVTARHAVRQHSATQLTGIGAALGSLFVPGLDQSAGQQLVNLLGTVMLRGYGREHELEADRLGAEYLAKTGYSPAAMLDVVRVLKNQELFEIKLAKEEGRRANVYHGLFSTHPDNDTRLQEVISSAENLKSSASARVERGEYLQRTDGMVFGAGSKQGVIKDEDFYHADLDFTLRFPDQWQINNTPNNLFAMAPDSAAMLQLSLLPADQTLSPAQFMTDKMGLSSAQNKSELTINGLPAAAATAPVKMGDVQRLARIVVIYHKDMAFIITGVTQKPASIANYDQLFLNTARSFRPLTKAEYILANQTDRIHLIKINPSNSFKSLATETSLKKFPEEQLRLLNGLYPKGNLRPGQLFKTVKN